MIVVSFDSTSHAMRADRLFETSDIIKMVVPTPRDISHSCGISIRIEKEQLQQVKDLIEENNIDVKGIYKIENNEATKLC